MLKNDPAVRDLGKVYAAKAPEYLEKELGVKAADLSQFAMFHVSAVAWLIAQGFTTVLEKAGVEEAERFLALVMAATSAAVRLKRAPFMLQLSAKLDPVDEQAALEESPDFKLCQCSLSETKECPSCPGELKSEYRGLIDFMVGYVKDVGHRTARVSTFCTPCGAKYADAVIAEIVTEGISKAQEPEGLKQQAVMAALQTIQAFGITEAPLTVQALQARQE